MATKLNSTEGTILSTFATAGSIFAAYEGLTEAERRTPNNPAYDRWNNLYSVMDNTPMPANLAEAAALLRWGLATNNGPAEELEHLLLNDTPEQILAYIERNWSGFASDTRHAFGALALIEKIRAAATVNSGPIAEALADYRDKRAASEAMPLGSPREDEAVEAYCQVADRLIEEMPAANLADVVTKFDLALERSDFFEVHRTAILNDLRRLASGSAVVAAPSLILAMHARYEKAWDEYNTIDHADGKLGTDGSAEALSKRFGLQEALRRNSDETDALRLAILYQVPNTWQEALILAFHVHGIDPVDSRELSSDEKKAYETGSDTLLDFLMSSVPHDGIAGYQFSNAAGIVSHRRRGRTGQVGEAA